MRIAQNIIICAGFWLLTASVHTQEFVRMPLGVYEGRGRQLKLDGIFDHASCTVYGVLFSIAYDSAAPAVDLLELSADGNIVQINFISAGVSNSQDKYNIHAEYTVSNKDYLRLLDAKQIEFKFNKEKAIIIDGIQKQQLLQNIHLKET